MLRIEIERFEAWSRIANTEDSGWEADYPNYAGLVRIAIESMEELLETCTPAACEDIARVWSISEEREDLADWAVDHAPQYLNLFLIILLFGDWKCRYQIYALSTKIGKCGTAIALAGTYDTDPYVARRSFFALQDLDGSAAKHAAKRLVVHHDQDVSRFAADYLDGEDESDRKLIKKRKQVDG